MSLLPSDKPHNCSNCRRGKLNNSIPFVFSNCLQILQIKYTCICWMMIDRFRYSYEDYIHSIYFCENPLAANQVWTSWGVECWFNQISCVLSLLSGAFAFFSRNILRTNLSSFWTSSWFLEMPFRSKNMCHKFNDDNY